MKKVLMALTLLIISGLAVGASSVRCGPSPPPPPNCTVASCACDQYGKNCHWTYNCR